MSCQISSVYFLLLFVCCQLCGKMCVAQTALSPAAGNLNLIDVFLKPEDGEIKKVLKSPDAGSEDLSKLNVKHIDLFSLVAANKVIFAMAEINYTDNTERKIDVLAKYFETTESSWGDQAFGGKGEKWIVKSGTEKVKDTSDKTVIKSFAVATKDNKIYHITISNSTLEDSTLPKPFPPPPAKWHVRFVEGTVTDSVGGKTTGKQIDLKSSIIPLSTQDDKLKSLDTQPEELPPSDGFAFVTDDNNILFFMKGKTNNGGNNKNIVAVFEFKIENSAKLKLLSVDILEECCPSFFHWGGEIIMAPGVCPGESNQNVKVFNKQNKIFDNVDKPIARLRDFLKDKQNFVTTKIKEKNVLLFTEQKSEDERSDAHLWMTDGTRVGYVGTVVGGFRGTFYGSVLHTDGELFALHPKYNADGHKEANNFSLRRLKNQFDKITLLLQKWEKSIETVSELCKNSEASDYICTTSLPTDGLVGFLHSTISERNTKKEWEDGCYYSNVIVENGEKVPNGFKFSGEKKGAKWIMKSQTGDQPYSFTDPGFTLAATVMIGSGTSGSHNSIIGVGLTVDTKNVGVWCTTGGKWGVMVGKDKKKITPSAVACESGKKYYVLFILDGTDISVYVNGQKLPELTNNKIEKKEKITHFYFGADNDLQTLKKTDVTITNVLLYNRPLKTHEIEKFKLQQNDKVDTQQKHENDRTILPNLDDSTIKTDGPLDTTATETATETDGAEIKLRLFSMNGVAPLSLLFGLFTLLGRYV